MRRPTVLRSILIASCLLLSQATALLGQRDLRELRARAEEGNPAAQFNLARLYVSGTGVPQDDLEAVRWYRLAADQGHTAAQHNLGLRYDLGSGVDEDDEEAGRWYRLAADL